MGNSNSQIAQSSQKSRYQLIAYKASINSAWRSGLISFPSLRPCGHKIMKKLGIVNKKSFTSVYWPDLKYRKYLSPSNIRSFRVNYGSFSVKEPILHFIKSCHRLCHLKITLGTINSDKELHPLMRMLKRHRKLKTLTISLELINGWQMERRPSLD